MANLCDNKYYIFCEDSAVLEKISDKLYDTFTVILEGEISWQDENTIEGFFTSRWNFPMRIFEDFFDEFSDESIYMRCLSEEYGCELVSMNIYSNGAWREPQYFDL